MVIAVDLSKGEGPETAELSTTFTRKRVVVYGMNYHPEVAGVGKYTGEIAEHLASVGMDVVAVTTPPHYPGWTVQAGYRNGYSTSKQNGVRVLRTPLLLRNNMRGIWRLIAPLSFALTSAPVVFWQILRHRPDTILCIEPTLFAAPVAQLAATLVGARAILHVQDLEVDAAFAVGHLGSKEWLKKLAYAFERFTLKRFQKVVTISNRMAERLVDKGIADEKVSVVRNWVDLAHIYPLDDTSPYRTELGFSENEFVVLYSGNIGAKQGLNVLLDAAEKLKDEKRIRFVIAGQGPSKAELEKRYGHLENLRFLPFQPYARLNEFMNMPDLHVLPQQRGAADLVLPSKLGGMLASGRRILITADEGTELAEFATGVATVVPPGEASLIVSAIQEILTKSDTIKTEARDRLTQKLAKNNCIAEFSTKLLH